LKERHIDCWYGYYKMYPWMRKIYEINLWLQEGPPEWCCSSSRGARIELLLQVGDPHLYFLVKFHDLICYWCKMRIIECWILCERRKVCVMMLIFWKVFWMYVYSRWKVVMWILKWWNYRWQRKYEKCDMRRGLTYI
jgi:hypothetical protein